MNSIVKLSVTGSVFVALALIVVLGLATGVSLNQIVEGLGNLLIVVGIVAFIILIISVVLYFIG